METPDLKAELQKLKNLHPALLWFLVFIPSILIVVIFYFTVYTPKTEAIESLSKQIKKQKKEIAKKERMIVRLPILKREFEEIKERYEEMKLQLPEEKEISDLLKQVSDLGIESGLKVLFWQPQNRKVHESGLVYEIPVKVNMSGIYHNLGIFYGKLTELNRIVNIVNINLQNPKLKGTKAQLNISFSAVTFSAIPESEIEGGK